MDIFLSPEAQKELDKIGDEVKQKYDKLYGESHRLLEAFKALGEATKVFIQAYAEHPGIETYKPLRAARTQETRAYNRWQRHKLRHNL